MKMGDAMAYHNLSYKYFLGHLVERDLKRAFELAVQAVKLGEVESYVSLAQYYEQLGNAEKYLAMLIVGTKGGSL